MKVESRIYMLNTVILDIATVLKINILKNNRFIASYSLMRNILV